MTFGDIITPWLALAAVLVPLIYIEKWLHRHLYGVGWLMSRGNPRTATALYYVILFPGVFVHEFTQYLVAGALNVRIKKDVDWPQAQTDGTLRLDFVRIQKARWYQAALVGAAPMFVGTALVWVISNHVLKLTELLDAFGQHDIRLMGTAVENLANTPDFYIWLYLIFAISNAMFPTPADRQGWPLFVGAFSALVVVLMVLGVNPDVLLTWYKDHIAAGVGIMTTAFAAVLVVSLSSIFVIGFLEEVLERVTRQKFDYRRTKSHTGTRRRSGREPGSAEPLPFDAPLPSIYATHLPIPDPAKRSMLPPRKNAPTPALPETTPRTQPPMRGPAQALDQPSRAAASMPDRVPTASAPPLRREDTLANPQRPTRPVNPGAVPGGTTPFRREETPTTSIPRPERPARSFDPNVTIEGDANSTQRFMTPVSRGAQSSTAQPSGLSPRTGPTAPRANTGALPERRLSPFAPPPDDFDDEDLDADDETLDEEGLDDVELVDFDDL